MLTTRNRLRARAAVASLLAASMAQAHPGHAVDGLIAGIAHPFMGLDHLLAMVAVGLWSAAAFGAARRWRGPAVFLAMLLLGAVLATTGLVLPQVEAGVAFSVVLLAALMLGARRVPVSVGLVIVAVVALLHGQAHGVEWQAGHSLRAYAAGFAAGSMALHAAGLAAGAGLQRVQAWVGRAAAAAIGGSGLLMLAARL